MHAAPILLFEHSPDDQGLILRALRKSNIAIPVVIANDGQEALALLSGLTEGQAMLPRLILLDLKLPTLGGLEILERIRAGHRTRNVPVVVLSSSSELEDINRSYDCGANSYVRKSVSIQRVRRDHSASRDLLAGAEHAGLSVTVWLGGDKTFEIVLFRKNRGRPRIQAHSSRR